MFCPNCYAYMREEHLVKWNAKKCDDIIIEYDARCPACNEEIGHMSWGVFTPAERFQNKIEHPDIMPPAAQDEPASQVDAENNPPIQKETIVNEVQFNWPKQTEKDSCSCPHCGKLLPKEYKKIN